MISNDQELKATQDRIVYFEQLLAQFRVTTSPDEFKLMSGAYSMLAVSHGSRAIQSEFGAKRNTIPPSASFGSRSLARDGSIALVFNSEGMYRGAANSAGRFEVKIWE